MDIIQCCRELAGFSEEPGWTTRTYLSPPMRQAHALLRGWMARLGMRVAVDAVGNLRGFYAARRAQAPKLLIGSHLDTVPHAGAFDGVLGVVLGIALVERLRGGKLPFAIEVLGFAEEEGVRFGVPFIGSRALVGTVDDALLGLRDAQGVTVADAIRAFGLNPLQVPAAAIGDDVFGYLEMHIEQGPVLDGLGQPLGVVETIAGQSRWEVRFEGSANHAGTTPMSRRRDALAGAAEWIALVERAACATAGLVATVGSLQVSPGAFNIIPGEVRATLDVRHAQDETRLRAAQRMRLGAEEIAARRSLELRWEQRLDQPATNMSPALMEMLDCGGADGAPRMVSGAGHDAMILARKVPAAMLFLRSPGGISHHPDETVLPEDVEAALTAGLRFLEQCEAQYG